MKFIFKISLLSVLFTSSAQSAELRTFLKNCAYGTFAGSMAGVVSLAFSDKPSDNAANIAKGASLGLYAGIGYGLYQLNQEKSKDTDLVTITPRINQDKKIDGANMLVELVTF